MLSALRLTTMRDRGNHNVYTVFSPQLETVVADDNQEMITFVIAQYEELGENRLDDILRNSLMEMIRRLMARNQNEPQAAAGA